MLNLLIKPEPYAGTVIPVTSCRRRLRLVLWAETAKNKRSLKGRASVTKNLSSGLNFLLTDQEDKAIEQLLQLLDVEAATIDTYLALANLFRRRGRLG